MTAPAFTMPHVMRPSTPGTLAPDERPPLLLLLHGVGSNEASMAPFMEAFDPRLVVVCVRSPLSLGPRSFAWFHVSFTDRGPVIDEPEARAAWTRLPHVIDEAVVSFGADPARVYLAGFSQGGIVSLATLLTAPERVAGAAVMSGRLLPEVLPHVVAPERLGAKPLLIVHGTDDRTLPLAHAHHAREALAGLPIELTYRECAMGHAVTPESLQVVSAWLTARLDAPPGLGAPAAR